MSYLAAAIIGVLILLNSIVFAFLLWLSCKICRVRRDNPQGDSPPRVGIRYARALAVVLGLGLCGAFTLFVLWLLVPARSDSDLRFSGLSLISHFALLLVFVRLFVCPHIGRTVLVALLYDILGAVYTVGFALVVNSVLISSYVMPTGSMAETLLGYHKDVICPTCGLQFAINCSAEADASEGRPMTTFACICPNCRQRIHFPSAPKSYSIDNRDSVLIDDPGVQRGDRFSVGRGLMGPDVIALHRFDLVAHEFPFQRSLIYVKRLVGLPGETIAIQGGDLYVLRADKALEFDKYEAQQNVQDASEAKSLMHVNDGDAVGRFEKGQFEILYKSQEQILAMRRLVYDNDHPAKGRPPRWNGEEGWSESGNGFRSEAASGDRSAWLRYRHLLPDIAGTPALITDMMGYNGYQSMAHSPLLGENWVGDLILECEATIDNPQGELTLELSRGVDRFRAQWDLSAGTCTLLRVTANGEQKLECKATALKEKGTYRLCFANVDRRLVLWVDGELPFDDGVTYAPPEDLGPTRENDLNEPASIAVRGASVAIHKLKLFRDTYYTVGGVKQGLPHEADVHGVDPTDQLTWRELSSPPFVTLYVQPGHYFMLGDNSPESSDSRSWGAVPHRLLLGRAFFVYYPWKKVGPLH